MAGHLSPALQDFIHRCIPTFRAAELLLFFAANRERDYSPEEIVVCMRPAVITTSAVREYATTFTANDLTTETRGRFRYGPLSWDSERAIAELALAYNEQPVTLIVTIHHITESRSGTSPM
jgi:hypothetical protein